uniref:(northern house mosquito) hypothetical protein n=1 Tax=Culex pipiens TaxID=7175 RepID=A0A8D8CLA2_CULPI
MDDQLPLELIIRDAVQFEKVFGSLEVVIKIRTGNEILQRSDQLHRVFRRAGVLLFFFRLCHGTDLEHYDHTARGFWRPRQTSPFRSLYLLDYSTRYQQPRCYFPSSPMSFRCGLKD